MVKLADLVHIANNAKTSSQKNAVGEEVKKLIRGQKACYPEQQFFTKIQMTPLKINKATRLRVIGKGTYGTVFYGCLDDKCKTQVAIKVTTEPSARMEYRIAEKLRGMGVPRMYHFKSCDRDDVLYFEYIEGEPLEKWIKRSQSPEDYRQVISQLITNLKAIHEKYPKFRHHDLHWNNILVLKGNKPIMIDFGMSTIEGIRNPNVVSGEFKNSGIYSGSHQMYDAHYILNIIYNYTKSVPVRHFMEDLFSRQYLLRSSPVTKDFRLRPLKHTGLPTYVQILKHPFLQAKKKIAILRKIIPKKTVALNPKPPAKPATMSAIRRARAVLQKEAEKKKLPPKRPGIAKRKPSVMSQVREIEKKIAVNKPKIFINKNGDLKIDRRKCRLYKKEELVKMFKLDSNLTKEQMCKFIKNM